MYIKIIICYKMEKFALECSGNDNCECNECNYDSNSDSDHNSYNRVGKVFNHLPRGAIPLEEFKRRNNGYHAPISFNTRHHTRPVSMGVPLYPLDNIVGLDSGMEGKISISFISESGQLTFSWESFRGQLGGHGISHISLSTCLPYMPTYTLCIPIVLEYNGVGQTGCVKVEPREPTEQIKFITNISGQRNPKKGDVIRVSGGAFTFIINQC